MSNGFVFSRRSEESLRGVNPKLQAVVRRALQLSKVDFIVIEGLRAAERQRQLLAERKTKVAHSKHQDGLAVDLFPVGGTWKAAEFFPLRDAMFAAASEQGVTLRWGGDFNGDGHTVGNDNWDCPHFELR